VKETTTIKDITWFNNVRRNATDVTLFMGDVIKITPGLIKAIKA